MKKIIIIMLTTFVSTLVVLSCKKVEPTTAAVCTADLPIILAETPRNSVSDSMSSDGIIYCHDEEVEFGPKYIEFISYDPQTSLIWPGAVISYPSIVYGGYTPITGDMLPVTISASISSFNGAAGRTVGNPSLSTMRTAIHEIVSQQQQGATTTAHLSWTTHKIHNEKEFNLEMGAGYGNMFFDINAQFNYQSSQVKSRYVITFTQVYYSVDVDAVQPGMEHHFKNSPSCNDPVLGGVSPVYVSSIKYGRKV